MLPLPRLDLVYIEYIFGRNAIELIWCPKCVTYQEAILSNYYPIITLYPIIGNINFDDLVKVMSVRFCHSKVILSPFITCRKRF